MRKYNAAYVRYKEESLKTTVLREVKNRLKSGKSKSFDKNLCPCNERRAERSKVETRYSGIKLELWQERKTQESYVNIIRTMVLPSF